MTYDQLGQGYTAMRRTELTAVEPSAVMIGQRPRRLAPVIRLDAEALPFEDDSFDAAMAIVSDHHWGDREAGLLEMRRVARDRVVLLNADPAEAERFWLTRDYLDGLSGLITSRYREAGYWREELQRSLGEVELRPVPVPHDCVDGFYQAFWRRPRAYLDKRVGTAPPSSACFRAHGSRAPSPSFKAISTTAPGMRVTESCSRSPTSTSGCAVS